MDITSFLIGKEVGGGSAPTPTYQDKEITITQNGEQTITADEGFDALSSVEITTSVPQPSGKITITENGTDINISSYATADVSVGGGASEYFNTSLKPPKGDAYNPPGFCKLVKKFPSTITFTAPSSYDWSGIDRFFWTADLSAGIPKLEGITDLRYFMALFMKATLPTKVDLSNWSFGSNIRSMAEMFWMTNAEEIDMSSVGNINYSSSPIVDFKNMFYQCTSLKKVNLSNLNVPLPSGTSTNKTADINNMFNQCTAMEEIDMSSFDFSVQSSSDNPFGTSASYGVPDNCLIYVKDQASKTWIETNIPRLTNVQIKGA